MKGKALVTGGAGFIGSRLAERLIREGWEVVVVDDLSNGSRELVPKDAEFVEMNIKDPAIRDVFARVKPDFVFHLAAQIDVRVSLNDPVRDAETNILGALRVLEASVAVGARKLVFSSSGGAMYHEPAVIPTPESEPAAPLSPYGAAKRAFELYLQSAERNFGLRYVALRYANVYGPRQGLKGEAGVIGLFAKMMLSGQAPTIFGDGEQTRDFVFVDDVVEADVLAMREGATGIFNIGTGVETSVNRAAELIKKSAGFGGEIVRGPAAAIDERRSCLDSARAREVLGWKPAVGVEEGIKRTVEWFRGKGE